MPTSILKTFDYSFRSFLKHRVNGGMVLMITAVLAMIAANSPWSDLYHSYRNIPVSLQIGSFNLFSHHGEPLTLMAFINDALMAVFFFSVGLEIKREILVGELSGLKKALLPIIAAAGGMIFPLVIYSLFTYDTPAFKGLAIPMATDIAFSLGVLSLLGNRVPLSLKIFLTAFAVVDDIGGILIIALFYTAHLDAAFLAAGIALLLVLAAANRMNITAHYFYILIGIAVWYLFLQSGVHATIAGVLVAFTIPASPEIGVEKYIARIQANVMEFPRLDKEEEEKSAEKNGDKEIQADSKNGKKSCRTVFMLSHHQIDVLKSIESASDHVISPLQYMEDRMHRMVNYLIMPLFAFTNAGITLDTAEGAGFGQLTAAVFFGLVIGKFIGIFLFTLLAVKSRVTSLPEGITWSNIAGVSLLGGIGFTVSLFITNLSFGTDALQLLNQAKLGVLLGTAVAGILGYIVLKLTLPKTPAAETDLLAEEEEECIQQQTVQAENKA